ncbi:hypothetical protein [Nitrospira sp. Nam74]
MSTRRQQVLVLALIGTVIILAPQISAATETEGPPRGHLKISGVVVEKAGTLAVNGPGGATYQLNPNVSQRHGHEPPKEGDEVTILLNTNNAVIDLHPKGQEGIHRFVTGKLIYVGRMKPEIKLATSDGERVFPIERQEIKTGDFPEGSLVTAELNEAGVLIDLHRASGNDKH